MGDSSVFSLLCGDFNGFQDFVFLLELLTLQFGGKAQGDDGGSVQSGLFQQPLVSRGAGSQTQDGNESGGNFHGIELFYSYLIRSLLDEVSQGFENHHCSLI